jgi:hypothetical protein
VEAAEQRRAIAASFLCSVHVNQLQLDGLYAMRRGVKEGVINEDNAIKRLERSCLWGWAARPLRANCSSRSLSACAPWQRYYGIACRRDHSRKRCKRLARVRIVRRGGAGVSTSITLI